MFYNFSKVLAALLFASCLNVSAQKLQTHKSFKVVPLGIRGGLDEGNLSAYMLAPYGSNDYVCLDAGTIRHGLDRAVRKNVFKVTAGEVLKNYIKGYLISHAHLDHVSGLIINSPDDAPKNIYGLSPVIDVLKEKYFTWDSWANFADAGEKPFIGKYHYSVLPENKDTLLANTSMRVKAFPLSHVNPYESTAFLVSHQEDNILYLGDTGPDSVEHSNRLRSLWKEVSPLVKSHQLKAIFIEVSYRDEQPDKQLFGHLTPKWLMQEMDVLSSFTGEKALEGLPLVITHIKPAAGIEQKIREQLTQRNRLRFKLVFPQQSQVLTF